MQAVESGTMPIQERSIATERGDMAWLDAGQGWPLILLHAFPLNASMWRPQLENVPEGWRLIAPDFRGFGRSPLGSAPITIDGLAADVGALMDALKIEEATIAGLSMGGYVAFGMYRQEPARVTGLVLADTRAPADTAEGRAGRVRMREALAQHGPRAIADQMLPKLLSPDASPALAAEVRAIIEAADPRALDATIDALMNRPDATPDLPGISRGTLIVVGEHDTVTPPADAEALQRGIPRSTLTVIPGAAHLSSLEQPAVFSRVLEDFLLAHF
jgi:3-oxoadipate enol-lactonase